MLQTLNIKRIINMTPTRTEDRDGGVNNYHESSNLFKYQRFPLYDNQGADLFSVLVSQHFN